MTPVELVDSEHAESSPACSAGGLELYFGSPRPGGLGRFDIRVALPSVATEPRSELRNVEPLKSPGPEEPGWLSPDDRRIVRGTERLRAVLARLPNTCLPQEPVEPLGFRRVELQDR